MNRLALAPTTLPNAEPLEYLTAAAEAGYDAVGIRLSRSPGMAFHPVLGNAPLIRDMKLVIADSGMGVIDILSFYLEPATDVRNYERLLALSAEFGAGYVLTMGADPEWGRMRDNFGRFCDMAAVYGLSCALEFAVMRPLASLEQSVRLIAESGRGNTAITIDPLNLVRGGDGAAELRALDPKLLPYAQITDGLLGPGEPDRALLGRMGPNQRRMLGQGVVPLYDILDALPAGLPLSVELPDVTDVAVSAAEWARRTLENTRDFLIGYYAARGTPA